MKQKNINLAVRIVTFTRATTVPTFGTEVFNGCNIVIYVPDALYTEYSSVPSLSIHLIKRESER